MTAGAPTLAVTVRAQAEFYDLDAMNVVWHGNYLRFLEIGRCAVLDAIGYSYAAMSASNYAWPVVDLRVRYAKPIRLREPFDVRTTLVEWQNRLKLDFELNDVASGARLCRASTTQVAVDMRTETMLWETPPILHEKLAAYWRAQSSS